MQVGKKVVCVNDVFADWVFKIYKELPTIGKTYTVRSVRLGRSVPGVIKDGKLVKNGGSDAAPNVALLLEELHNPDDPWGPTNSKGGVELGFDSDRFRELDTETESNEIYASDTAGGEVLKHEVKLTTFYHP
jgi:hypothetical protein